LEKLFVWVVEFLSTIEWEALLIIREREGKREGLYRYSGCGEYYNP
jgi:hypothetical protein